jgi:hypothetical protein
MRIEVSGSRLEVCSKDLIVPALDGPHEGCARVCDSVGWVSGKSKIGPRQLLRGGAKQDKLLRQTYTWS